AKANGPLQAALREAAGHHQVVAGLAVPADLRTELKSEVAREFKKESFEGAVVHALKPVLEVQSLSLVVDTGKETSARVQLTFADEPGAKRAYWPVRDGLALVRLFMAPLRAKLRGQKELVPFVPLLNKAEAALRSATVKRDNQNVDVALRVK